MRQGFIVMARGHVDERGGLWHLLRMLHIIVFMSAVLLLVLGTLRYGKGIAPLRTSEGTALPGFPGPRGLVGRLDGLERKQRVIMAGSRPSPGKDGSIILPERWEGHMTVGRMAAVAHTWGLCRLAEDDPQGARERERAMFRTNIVTFFVLLIAAALFFVKHVDIKVAIAFVAGTWAFMSFLAIPTQYREWKAKDVARERLKETGLWPQLPQDGAALEVCLKAMTWCRVAGFRSVTAK